jgi:hypothetical protein
MRPKKSTLMKNAQRLKKSRLVKKLVGVTHLMHFTREVDVTILLVAIGVAAAVMMRVALSGGPADNASATAPSTTVAAKASTFETTGSALPARSASRPATPQSSVIAVQQPTVAAPQLVTEQTPVTLTGCLELDNEAFRLKDTTGANAPKARSWKSGFLKKNPASIEVIDRANRVQLPDHVGQRVVVTGLLVDREMQVRSLRRVAASCNQTA